MAVVTLTRCEAFSPSPSGVQTFSGGLQTLPGLQIPPSCGPRNISLLGDLITASP